VASPLSKDGAAAQVDFCLIVLFSPSPAFANLVETKRTLREVKLLRHFKHANIVEILDIMKPDTFDKFDDVYIVNELMNVRAHNTLVAEQQQQLKQ